MGGMEYTTTLVVIAHTLHVHVDRCMRTEDVACQITKNNLSRAMQEWLCTTKAEMTREAEARSRDETMGNVWHRLAACEHLLDIKSWKHGDPPPVQGMSIATATRHPRILRRRIEEQIRGSPMDIGTQNSESFPRRSSSLSPSLSVSNI
jgi:hypothetical protein